MTMSTRCRACQRIASRKGVPACWPPLRGALGKAQQRNPVTLVSTHAVEPPHRPDDPARLARIRASMREHGWSGRPLLVVPCGDGYLALTGSHRVAAARAEGVEKIPVVVANDEAVELLDELTRGRIDRLDLRVTGMETIADTIKGVDPEAAALAEQESIERDRESMPNPWPLNNVDQVAPGLYQGAWPELHHGRAYDLVVRAADDAWRYYLDHGGSLEEAGNLISIFLTDDPDFDWLGQPGWSRDVMEVVDEIVAEVKRGGRVLVVCNQGLNRSGLLVALALTRLGRSPSEAVRQIRAARGPRALSNPKFEEAVAALGSLRSRAWSTLRRAAGWSA